MARPSLPTELWLYVKARRRWWLIPLLVVMLLIGTMIFFAQGSVLAPFIYTIF